MKNRVKFNDASNQVFGSRPMSNENIPKSYQTSSPLNKTVGKNIKQTC